MSVGAQDVVCGVEGKRQGKTGDQTQPWSVKGVRAGQHWFNNNEESKE